VNTDAPWPTPSAAEARVLEIQTKLHRWARDDPDRRFDDLYNLVCDPAFLVAAWRRVRGNRGARSAGVDGETAHYVTAVRGEQAFLSELRAALKARSYRPTLVRETMIPKPGGKRRRLGIATVRDRVVQAALKLVLEPIFEADFKPCSYGFRPRRRAQDAIAEIHFFCSRSYEWVLEGDIEACFDEISHCALLARVRDRVGDRRVLGLVKAFLKTGVLSEDGVERNTLTGTPQGGILSPLLANIALSVLDEYYARAWEAMGSRTERAKRRRHGEANYRLVRYADDWLICVAGGRSHAEALVAETEQVIAPLGLTLSKEKTRVTHIDEGVEFLGWRIKRQRGRDGRPHVYTYPSKRSLQAVKAKVKEITRSDSNQPLGQLLHRLNPVLRGWCAYFRPGVSSRTFNYLRAYTWRRVVRWLRRKHRRANWRWLKRRYLPGWWPTDGATALYNPGGVRTTRYHYRGKSIQTPWEAGALATSEPALPLERLEGLIAR
jgi:RNA-directed DNA polymerase